jgi:hypothetical protein
MIIVANKQINDLFRMLLNSDNPSHDEGLDPCQN